MPYLFDGNNLIGKSSTESGRNPQIQRAFLSNLSGYKKSGGGRFLVYFDGDDADRSIPPPGIRIRFSSPLSADDAIIQRLREIRRPSEVIVVTNDRNLQSRCRNAGAKIMDWKQFLSAMKSRNVRKSPVRKTNETEVDVEDWMEYFGLKGE